MPVAAVTLNKMKLSIFFVVPVVVAFAPQPVFQRGGVVEGLSRRELMEAAPVAATLAAVVAPLAADARPPQLESMTPRGKPKSGEAESCGASSGFVRSQARLRRETPARS